MNDFWQQHKERLRGYVARRVRERDAIDDILQDVYLKAHLSLPTLRAKGKLTPWLYRITANAIADYYRALPATAPLPAALADELPQERPEPDHVAELAGCLQPLIAELPEIYRRALQLSEIDELPQKAVAERLGLSLSGAKSRIQRGREKLKARLLACCDVECERGRIVGYSRRDDQGGYCDNECS
ncbi:RNA polymerase sigma factor SigZ [Sedimenticola hydrogenitrophicus]|uniref:RNA polymerase sigma factor SigZ n=1 Tax=Sedimenticola hydrogenitrophicus TaxID=2967975 RepID=UPI0021A9365E|nr:RNA polymerase sigma factor SigZ [Sedimenticola hydrogenitrophicus]